MKNLRKLGKVEQQHCNNPTKLEDDHDYRFLICSASGAHFSGSRKVQTT